MCFTAIHLFALKRLNPNFDTNEKQNTLTRIIDMSREDFYNYVLDFYNGETGIYKDVDATYAEVVDATRKLEKMYRSHGEEPVYDSIDRERVRDFILEGRK
jgi:hypothetical protein